MMARWLVTVLMPCTFLKRTFIKYFQDIINFYLFFFSTKFSGWVGAFDDIWSLLESDGDGVASDQVRALGRASKLVG